jgi:FMN hydrolase / 5-amino-6-(5-phospho-D-ribitylamino)uracil phosphatase
MNYKVISFDIFQTLVDVNKRIPDIWRAILKEEFSNDKAEQGSRAILGMYPSIYEKAVSAEKFETMEEVYSKCVEKAMNELNFAVSPKDVLYHLMYQHSKAPFYSEVCDCIKKLHRNYKIVLSSDSNHLMVDELIGKIEHDKAFISDDLKSYKGNVNGGFFDSVITDLKVEPKSIIHIGDSTADVIGAHRAGITSCWLNRDNRKWNCDITPDYIITNLNELTDIL